EVFGKTLPIASKLFMEAPRGHPVNRSEVAIEHHLLVTDGQNSNVWRLVSHTADGNGLSFSTNQASRRYQLAGGSCMRSQFVTAYSCGSQRCGYSRTLMAKYRIAWMPGDGVGNDVMEATRIVLDRMKFDAEY